MRRIAAILAALFLVPAASPAGAAGDGGSGIAAPPSVSLLEAVQTALSRSREGRLAARDVRIAEEGKTVAAAGRLPRLDAGSDLTLLSDPPAVFFQGREVQTMERSVVRARVTAEHTIYDFGKTGSRVAGAEARVDASEKRAEAVRERVAVDVIGAFLASRRADEMRRVAEESLAAAREHRRVAGELYDMGTVARNDVLAADVKVANEEAALITAENRVELSRSVLARRMGYSGDQVSAPEPGEYPVPPDRLPPLSESVRVATAKRPELMARGASVREGETAVDAATAEFAPTFFGQGGYSYESNEFNPNPNVFSLLLGGRINLFSGFSDAAARRGALLAVEQRKEELALARDEVALAVKRAHLLAVEAEKRKAVAEVAIERAEENLRIQNDRYREGLAISTEVLDAQTLLTRAKVDLANASFDVVEARYDLLAERGELLEFLGPLLGAEKGP